MTSCAGGDAERPAFPAACVFRSNHYFFFELRFFPFLWRFFFLILMLQVLFQLTFAMWALLGRKGHTILEEPRESPPPPSFTAATAAAFWVIERWRVRPDGGKPLTKRCPGGYR